jgi:hypothetical protein
MTPARPSAAALVEALMALLQTADDFRDAVRNVPSYTGQHAEADFYADEQEAYNRACDAYEDAVRNSVAAPAHTAARRPQPDHPRPKFPRLRPDDGFCVQCRSEFRRCACCLQCKVVPCVCAQTLRLNALRDAGQVMVINGEPRINNCGKRFGDEANCPMCPGVGCLEPLL